MVFKKNNRKIRAAIVGAGLISGKRHIPAFKRQKALVELVAICDLNLDGAKAMARQFGIKKVYREISEVIEKERPDLLDICTPPNTHRQLAVEAMKGGAHVLIEKPMALSIEDCDEIVRAAKKFRKKVCVAHTDLFYRSFMEARRKVKEGTIGKFRGMRLFLSTPTSYITSKPNHWAHKLPGGVIGETGPHAVYMSLAFINPIQQVSVQAKKILDYPWSAFEDFRIDLVGEAGISSIILNYSTSQWMARVDLFGDQGTLMVDLEGRSLIRYRRPELRSLPVALSILSESGQILGNLLSSGMDVFRGGFRSTHDYLVESYLESLVRNEDPPVSAEEGREAVRVLGMIVQRLREKSPSVGIPSGAMRKGTAPLGVPIEGNS